MILPDLLEVKLDLVLCGTAPSEVSKDARAYYAHPGNIFWKTLFECGLTPRLIYPKEYAELLGCRIGLTDLNKHEAGADSELSESEFRIEDFKNKMLQFKPKIIGFTSKFAATKYFGRSGVSYGLQVERLEDIQLVVLPSTSGRARRYFDITHWRFVAQMARSLAQLP